MPGPRQGRRAPRLEVGFEPGRSGEGALGRAYECLLPWSARPIPSGLRAPRKEVHHEVPSPESRATAGAAAGGDLRQGLLQGCSTLWDAEKVEEVIDATDGSAEAVLRE